VVIFSDNVARVPWYFIIKPLILVIFGKKNIFYVNISFICRNFKSKTHSFDKCVILWFSSEGTIMLWFSKHKFSPIIQRVLTAFPPLRQSTKYIFLCGYVCKPIFGSPPTDKPFIRRFSMPLGNPLVLCHAFFEIV